MRLLLSALLLLSASVTRAEPQRMFIVGDAVAAEVGPERTPQAGWGQVLQSYLDPHAWQVRNHARDERSARRFTAEGPLDAITELRRGDVVLIQFGHDDVKRQDSSRDDDLQQTVARALMQARAKGATPVLVTPLARPVFKEGAPLDTAAPGIQTLQRLASTQQVALIDLDASSRAWLRELGERGARPYLFVPEQDAAADSRFNIAGANALACLALRDVVQAMPALRPALVRDLDCDVLRPTHASAQSQVLHEDALARDQPGPHGGAGPTTAYPFFADVQDLPFVLRKRVLHKGAGIGLHPQHKDEIYYVVSGHGSYVLDGTQYDVRAGYALLTRPGSRHALQQVGEEPLVLLLVYPR
ncbi:lysophospholipase L1-like esterase/quercetin dioxygenase-like cupin family protein [Xanthomonas sacchari]|uniref:cupin domain-containing protein n=1 Tax=Xanthomonas sp. F10 TaxID=3035309 RepID=UPI00161C19F1|nr:cupin domain-containing protein [Xanthomonas sp. F10]MBB6368581.1 lysophospholipase L1-like esterase/quercetin dioxygenase-like cupin family protein [Xanthomonas sp. F10]